ncbi:YdeI/OmpD-associated family protein [Thioclava pacifica]|uniref:YdhG-like domain-containing protein n=1 Tax=Thioclava pacifica DSM 10166 TaxID=1353537 RepID=A0A074JAF8_9RHOB|nr:YdeI/OmpD-associated family protein [Thioclava pacifica]KEO53529.1 hypothetical protein TP2_17590 [Thioclava pacifica DSM 10166]
MISDAEAYFTRSCGRCARFDTPDCSTQHWAEGLAALRALCRAAGLEECVKWGHPCYTHAGRNVAIIGAFRDNFRLTFFDAERLEDPRQLLERRGPNSREADMLTFTDVAQVAARAEDIREFLAQGRAQAEAGPRPKRAPAKLDPPEELRAALAADPALSKAFAALTPGRQRAYMLDIGARKKSQTRAARIAHHRAAILSGKGLHDR